MSRYVKGNFGQNGLLVRGTLDKRSMLTAAALALCLPASALGNARVGTETSPNQIDFYDTGDESSTLTATRSVVPGAGNDTIVFDDGPADQMSEAGAPANCQGEPMLPPFATITCTGYDGAGFVNMRGGPGNDLLAAISNGFSTFRFEIRGDAGFDTVSYAGAPGPVTASLDGAANDGVSGNDVIRTDVEALVGGPGPDRLGAGSYPVILQGSGGNDTITARNGQADLVGCGAGTDNVQADGTDQVGGDCESVDRPTAAQLAPPQLARTFNLERVTGRVFIKVGKNPKVPLAAGAQVPAGTLIYAEKGRVTVIAERKGKGDVDKFVFTGGTFELKQSSKTGITETLLRGGSFTSCRARKSIASSAARKRKRIRRLFGRGKGRFRTRGRYGSATVRGTAYSVTDRCDGTAVKVTEGGVRVRSFKLGKTVVLSVRRIDGKRFKRSFLAPARRPGR